MGRIFSIFILLCLILTTPLCTLAAVPIKVLENKIGAAKILPANEKFLLSTQGEEASLSKFKIERSKNPDRDAKIEAVLIAKIIIDADSSIKKVRTRFFEKSAPSNFSSITVRIGDIKSFASGAISQADLLGSLDQIAGTDPNSGMSALMPASTKVEPANASTVQSDSKTQVVEGPLKQQRSDLISRIGELKKGGVNTSAYESYFANIEETAKKNDERGTRDMVDKVSQNLESQEKAILRKKQEASGATDGGLNDFIDEQYSGNLDAAMQKAFPKIVNLALSTMAVPMSQAFKPKQGPYYFERLALAGHWNTYGGGDQSLFVQLEQAARTNDPRLGKMVQAALAKHSVSPQMVEFSRRIYALKKSQQRGR